MLFALSQQRVELGQARVQERPFGTQPLQGLTAIELVIVQRHKEADAFISAAQGVDGRVQLEAAEEGGFAGAGRAQEHQHRIVSAVFDDR